MGTLVIMHYPAFYNHSRVDHTYVVCGTKKKAWSCWGGKAGGKALRMGTGSTARADAIAQPNERAGIKCYAVTGVCHQAANRVAFPAGIIALGARGYGLSESIFGTYGRPSGPLGTCRSPFDQHDDVTGDTVECAEPEEEPQVQQPSAIPGQTGSSQSERDYIDSVLRIYDMSRVNLDVRLSDDDREEFDVQLFLNKVRYNLAGKAGSLGLLEEIYRGFDKPRIEYENMFARNEITASAFAVELNRQTLAFQEKMAGAVAPEQYEALFNLKPGEFEVLVDPDFVEQVYEKR